MSLRAALIEAGARSMHAPYPYDDLASTEQTVAVNVASDMLDAFLDTLAENADEWADSGREFDTISSAGNVTDKGYVWRLIAVLRGDE